MRASPACVFNSDVWGHVKDAGEWFATSPFLSQMRARWITDDFGDLWLIWGTMVHLDPFGKPWGHYGLTK